MGASGKLGEKQSLIFVKVKNHQTAQVLHFYKVERQTTLSTTSNLSNGFPKLQFSWVSQFRPTKMRTCAPLHHSFASKCLQSLQFSIHLLQNSILVKAALHHSRIFLTSYHPTLLPSLLSHPRLSLAYFKSISELMQALSDLLLNCVKWHLRVSPALPHSWSKIRIPQTSMTLSGNLKN